MSATLAPLREDGRTAGGASIGFRPIDPGDRAAFADLFAHLGPESRRRRYLAAKPELSQRELVFFTDVDHRTHEAVVAVDRAGGAMVGVARYAAFPERPGVAELAIEVADDYQGQGIGTALTGLTIGRARANGVTRLTARTLWENEAARRLLRRHGFRARSSQSGEIELELALGASTTGPVLAAPQPGTPAADDARTKSRTAPANRAG